MEKEHLLSYILINGRYLPPPEGQNQRNIDKRTLIKSTNDTLTLKETFIILSCFGKTHRQSWLCLSSLCVGSTTQTQNYHEIRSLFFYSLPIVLNKSKNDMKRITHLSIQNHGGVSITPFGVILSALAECESQDLTLYEKALHIDNALAIFARSGYEIKFCSDEDAMLIFEHSSEKK